MCTTIVSGKSLLGMPRFVAIGQGLVVWRPISVNPGLNFNPGLFIFSSKAFSRTIFSIIFRVANHQIVDKKNETEFAF